MRWTAALGALVVLPVFLAGCGAPNPHLIGNMPGVVQQVLDTSTPHGETIFDAILTVTGNASDIAQGLLPGSYTYGPAASTFGGNPSYYIGGYPSYYVNFEVPVNLKGLSNMVGSMPQPQMSQTEPGQVFITLSVPDLASDRLYYDPSTKEARFAFGLEPNGLILGRSWDGLAINGN